MANHLRSTSLSLSTTHASPRFGSQPSPPPLPTPSTTPTPPSGASLSSDQLPMIGGTQTMMARIFRGGRRNRALLLLAALVAVGFIFLLSYADPHRWSDSRRAAGSFVLEWAKHSWRSGAVTQTSSVDRGSASTEGGHTGDGAVPGEAELRPANVGQDFLSTLADSASVIKLLSDAKGDERLRALLFERPGPCDPSLLHALDPQLGVSHQDAAKDALNGSANQTSPPSFSTLAQSRLRVFLRPRYVARPLDDGSGIEIFSDEPFLPGGLESCRSIPVPIHDTPWEPAKEGDAGHPPSGPLDGKITHPPPPPSHAWAAGAGPFSGQATWQNPTHPSASEPHLPSYFLGAFLSPSDRARLQQDHMAPTLRSFSFVPSSALSPDPLTDPQSWDIGSFGNPMSSPMIAPLLSVPPPRRRHPVEAADILYARAQTVDGLLLTEPMFARFMDYNQSAIVILAPVDPNDDEPARERDREALRRFDDFTEKKGMKWASIELSDVRMWVHRWFHLVPTAWRAAQKLKRKPKWFQLADDDTLFLDKRYMYRMLEKYNPEEDHIIGTPKESMCLRDPVWGFTYGGGGIFISYPLMEKTFHLFDECHRDYAPRLERDNWGGDIMVAACAVRAMGLSLPFGYEIEEGLHQFEIGGDVSGMLQSGRKFITIHHFFTMSLFFPLWHIADRREHALLLSRAAEVLGGENMFTRFVFDSGRTVLTNGYTLTMYANPLTPGDLMRVEHTWDGPAYMVHPERYVTRPRVPDGEKTTLWLKSVKRVQEEAWENGEGRFAIFTYSNEEPGRPPQEIEVIWDAEMLLAQRGRT